MGAQLGDEAVKLSVLPSGILGQDTVLRSYEDAVENSQLAVEQTFVLHNYGEHVEL